LRSLFAADEIGSVTIGAENAKPANDSGDDANFSLERAIWESEIFEKPDHSV